MNPWQRFLYRRSSDLVRQIADILIGEPGNWRTADGYWLRNAAAKIDIWICNKAYALKLQVWPIEPGFPAEIRPSWAERSLLWSIVKRRRELSPEQIRKLNVAAVIRQRRSAA